MSKTIKLKKHEGAVVLRADGSVEVVLRNGEHEELQRKIAAEGFSPADLTCADVHVMQLAVALRALSYAAVTDSVREAVTALAKGEATLVGVCVRESTDEPGEPGDDDTLWN